MKRRLTFIARFWNAKPIEFSATCEAQAIKIAKGVAEKVNKLKETNPKWVFQSVGIVCRF